MDKYPKVIRMQGPNELWPIYNYLVPAHKKQHPLIPLGSKTDLKTSSEMTSNADTEL